MAASLQFSVSSGSVLLQKNDGKRALSVHRVCSLTSGFALEQKPAGNWTQQFPEEIKHRSRNRRIVKFSNFVPQQLWKEINHRSQMRKIDNLRNLGTPQLWGEINDRSLSTSGIQQLWGKLRHRSQNHQGRGGVASAALAGPATAGVASSLFHMATAIVAPFYTAMILAPRWTWTQKLMESEITFLILGAGYIYLLCLSWTPETLSLMLAGELSGISRMFTSTLTVASAWLHLLAADLFAGRQVFLDGVHHDVETRHSLLLCLVICPIGILSHLITKSLILTRRARDQIDVKVAPHFPSH